MVMELMKLIGVRALTEDGIQIYGGNQVVISEENIKNYIAKVEDIEKQKEEITANHFMQSKIEAHLEMLCMLGLTDMMQKMSKKK